VAWWINHEKASKAASESSSAPSVTEAKPAGERVEVVRPTRGGLQRRTIQPGSVHAFESVDLYAKVSGFLETQGVDIGDAVKQGQVLATIDAPEVDKDVEEAAAVVEQAKARADLAEARVATAEAERAAAVAAVAQAEADIDQHVARRELAGKEFERIRGLSAQSAVDRRLVDEHQHKLDAARAGERSAKAAVQTARAQLDAAAAKVHQAKADVADARATVRVTEAKLARARVVADFARIVAPFDGVVTRRNFFPGDFIRSAAEGEPLPLLTVKRTDLLRVVVQVPDLDVSLLDVGDPARVVVDALKGRSFAGKVSRLARAENPTTRTMRVEVDLPNPSGLLVEGMYGRATIDLMPHSDNLTVPAACVVGHAPESKGAVFVVRGGKVKRTPIVLGEDDGNLVEVLEGLGSDDEVVVRPGGSLEDGAVAVAVAAKPDASRH
jgi:RND family efflux transporter MFP subunit